MNDKSIQFKRRPFAFFFLLICICFSFATAADAGKTEDKKNSSDEPTETIFVDEIVVKGDAIKETATVEQITAEEIEDKGLKTVSEALQLIPGTYVQSGGKGESYIFIRGFSQHEVSILIDGIPLSSPYDGQIDLNSFPVDTIERIDVVKGASSVLYGANAMGGVVNIITKKSNGSKHLRLNGSYGSGKTSNANLSLQGSLGKIRYLFTGSYDNREYFRLSKDYIAAKNQATGKRLNSDKETLSGKVTLGWDLGNNGQAAISYSHIDQEKGIPHHESDPKAKYWRFTDWKDGIVDFEYHKTIGLFSYKSKVYYQYFNNVLNSYDDKTYTTQKSKNAFTDTYKDYSYGGDLFFRLGIKEAHLFKMAIRYRRDTHREQSNTGQPWEKDHANTLSIPLEGEWRTGPLFTFTYGASVDIMFLKAFKSFDNRTETSFNPQAAGVVHLSDYLSFRASASKKTRFATLKELFSTTSGNPALNPMKSDIFEVGVDYVPVTNISLSLAGFYNNVKNLINRATKDSPYINIDKAVFKGYEVGLQWRFLRQSAFSAYYTRLQALDKTTKTQTYIQYRPKHKIDASLSMKLPYKFNLNLDASYCSSQVYYDSKNVKRSLDPFTPINVKLSKNFGDIVSVFVRAENLWDVNYYESEGYPMEGRMVYAGIQLTVL